MPNKNKKKKREVIDNLQLEVKQLSAALNESRRYADKLVDHIPYLPADMDNLRKANLQFSNDIEALKRDREEGAQFIKAALDAAGQFTLSDEFPGPYTISRTLSEYKICSESGCSIATTKYSDFADFMVNVLNAVEKQIAAGA
jgi:hypothetical protein